MDSMENKTYWANLLQRNTDWGRAADEARRPAEPKKESWLQRVTGLNVWYALLWATFAFYVIDTGRDASIALHSKPEAVRMAHQMDMAARKYALNDPRNDDGGFRPLSRYRPSVPTIINGGRPSGGRLLSWDDEKTYRIDDLRGDWTLIVFAAYSCYEHGDGIVPMPANDCLWAQKKHYASLNRALDYFHKNLSPLGVKVWVVRIDYMFKQPPGFIPLPGAEPPKGHMDRYLLARMVKAGGMLRIESVEDAVKTNEWMIHQWARLSKTRQDVVSDNTAPYFALLDPKGYIRFMEVRTSNIAIVKGVYKALGKRLQAPPTPELATEEEDQALLGLLDMSDLYRPVDRDGKPQGGVRKSQLADKYISLFGRNLYYSQPAMYLLFGVKPANADDGNLLPDRPAFSFRKKADTGAGT